MGKPRQLGLALAQWPENLRQRAEGLSPQFTQAAGRFLAYCQATRVEASAQSVQAYLSWKQDLVRASTARRETIDLRYAMPTLMPGEDWTWLFAAAVQRRKTKKARVRRPSLLSVPPEQWPDPARAFLTADTVKESGPGRFKAILLRKPPVLQPQMRASIRKVYGQYLHHRRGCGEDDTITPDGLAGFVRTLEARGLRPRSIAIYVGSLKILTKAADFPGDWAWLAAAADELRQWASEYPKLKHARTLRHPLEIWRLGLSLVEQVRGNPTQTVTAAATFRDGVLLMLMIAQPLRISNVAGIKIGTTLMMEGDQAVGLTFPGEEMKNRYPYEARLWPELQPVLNEYISNWRPILARGYTGPELWLTGGGSAAQPLGYAGLYHAIFRRTQAAFGEAINPHFFRDIAASAMIEACPDHPGAASDLLHHRSPDSVREYTERASALNACRAMRQAVATARANARAQVLGSG